MSISPEHEYSRFEIIEGMPAVLWLDKIVFIKNFIKENKLQPVNRKHLLHRAVTDVTLTNGYEKWEKVKGKKAIARNRPRWIYGGIKIPHLHYKDDIYLLNREQWDSFSRSIVIGIAEKIEQSSEVGFDQLMIMSESTNGV